MRAKDEASIECSKICYLYSSDIVWSLIGCAAAIPWLMDSFVNGELYLYFGMGFAGGLGVE